VADILIKFHREWKTILLLTHDIHLLNYIKNSVNINLFKL
jgi:ABC-type lipoprotein export system ATPase subunit